LELTNFNPKRSADFVDSIIIRFFAENFELWQERPNKSLVPPTNNNREIANFDAFSRLLVNSKPTILLLGKINLSVLSAKSLGYNLRKIGFIQSFTYLYQFCSIEYRIYLL